MPQMFAVSEIRPVTLRDQVYRGIQEAIIQHRFVPGDRIYEEELTKQMKVSRTPVREALVLLEWDGLVEIRPNRGCFVTELDEDNVRDIFEMRLLLENRAVELIIDKLTEADFQALEDVIAHQKSLAGQDLAGAADLSFHEYLMVRSDSPRLVKAWKVIAGQFSLAFTYAEESELLNPQTAEEDHHRILAAFRSRDVAQVKSVNQSITDRVIGLIIDSMAMRSKETP